MPIDPASLVALALVRHLECRVRLLLEEARMGAGRTLAPFAAWSRFTDPVGNLDGSWAADARPVPERRDAVLRWIWFGTTALGVGGFAALLVYEGFSEILGGIVAIGWGLALIVAIRLAALTVAGLAWRAALGPDGRGRALLLIRLRIVREAINALLPAAQIGGDLIGGWLLSQEGVAPGPAMAGILVDVLLQTVTQGLFAVIGLAVLWFAFGDGPLVRDLGWGLLLAAPALGGFFMAQRFGLFAVVDRSLAALRRIWPGLGLERPLDLQPALRRLYADPAAIGFGAVLHLVGWSIGTAETWVALSRLGARPGFAEALVLESLGQAVRSAGFAVPGALGIQEGGYILLGSLFGLGAAEAVALSLAKRLPDLVLGLPGLCYWQALEAQRLRRR